MDKLQKANYMRFHAVLHLLWFFGVVVFLGCSDDEVSPLDDLPNGKVYFEHIPVDLSTVLHFGPMGQMGVHPKGHGGYILADPYVLPATNPVLAVADGVIILAGKGRRQVPDFVSPDQNRGEFYDDFTLQLQISKSLIVNYGHVSALNYELLPQLADLPTDERGHKFRIQVEAGDTLGFVGPHPALDFSVTDFDLELGLLNKRFYAAQGSPYRYSANIYDYFREPLLSSMIDIAQRDAPPWGGRIDYDVRGKISGNWFKSDITDFIQWSKHLCIAYSNIYSQRIQICDGSPMQDIAGYLDPGPPDLFWVRDDSPRPETVGVGSGLVTYELVGFNDLRPDSQRQTFGFMLVEMIKEGELTLEIVKGSVRPNGFSSNASKYAR